MRGGLVTSVLLHAAILGWALFTIQAQRELRVAEPEPIAVDLVSASDHTKLRQGARDGFDGEAQVVSDVLAGPRPYSGPSLESRKCGGQRRGTSPVTLKIS